MTPTERTVPPSVDDAAPRGEFPYRAFPTGWFQVAWSGEVRPGEVRPVRYFGLDLVIYRSLSGELIVLDAFCPHRGAHLGYGGVVEGESLICPNHGRCVHPGDPPAGGIGCGDGRSGPRRWPVREWSEIVYLWHDAYGGAPTWEPPHFEVAGDPRYYPAYPTGTVRGTVPFQPYLLTENMADMPHVKYVHRWVDIPSLDLWNEDGHHLHTIFSGTIPTPKGPCDIVLVNDAWGLGLVGADFTGLRHAIELIGITPIDEHASDLRISLWVERGPDDPGDGEADGLARAIYAAQAREVLDPNGKSDRPIWDHLRYVAHPPLAREEARLITRYRRWLKQFHPY